MTDDELISLYVDGQLVEVDKAAFEARLRSDSALRRRASVTQLLTTEARRTPELAVPRNFILSRDAAPKIESVSINKTASLIPSWVYRLGSVAAAGLFVVLVGAEALSSRSAAPMTTASNVLEATQMVADTVLQTEAPSAMTAMINTPLAQGMLGTAVGEATAPEVMMQSAPEAEAAPAIESSSARNMPTPQPQAKAAQTDIRPSNAESETQMQAAEPVATPAATPASAPVVDAQTTSNSTTLFTPSRLFALMALLVALALGALGWMRRP